MAKPVIVTEVGDLPMIIGGDVKRGTCGWVIKPDSASELHNAFAEITDNAVKTRQRTQNARRFFTENATGTVNATLIKQILCRNTRMMRLYPRLLTNSEVSKNITI